MFVALSYALDVLVDAPWAYLLFGRPTLTGAWVGEFMVPSGTRFALFLELQRKLLSNGTLKADDAVDPVISGQASWCDDHGRRAEDVPLEGDVPLLSGYHGSASQVEIDLESASHPQPGLLPAYFLGGWDVDTLTLKPTYIFWDGQAQAFVSSNDNTDLATPPTVVLKKSDETVFRAACTKLGDVPAADMVLSQ